jgi:hypothetical protein
MQKGSPSNNWYCGRITNATHSGYEAPETAARYISLKIIEGYLHEHPQSQRDQGAIVCYQKNVSTPKTKHI